MWLEIGSVKKEEKNKAASSTIKLARELFSYRVSFFFTVDPIDQREPSCIQSIFVIQFTNYKKKKLQSCPFGKILNILWTIAMQCILISTNGKREKMTQQQKKY